MSDDKIGATVAKASGLMMASLALSRILGVLRDSFMTGQFGKTALTDAYLAAFQIPDVLFFLIAGGALSSAFIPVFAEYWHTDQKDEAWRVFSGVASIMAVALLLVIGVSWVFAEPMLVGLAPGLKPEYRAIAADMSRIVLPAQFAFFIGGLMFGVLNVQRKFFAQGLGPNIYNLGIIFGAVVISHFVSPGVAGMAWGALIGAFLGNLILPGIVVARGGGQFRFTLDFGRPGVRKVFRLMAPVVFGLSLPGIYGMIMKGFGSYFSAGDLTALDLSNKLMQAPLGIFGQSFAIAAFPAFSQLFAQNKMEGFREQLSKTLRAVIYVTAPVALLLMALSTDVVRVLFQHGKFTSADTAIVAPCLMLFSIGIPAWCLHPVLMRAYFGMQQTVKPIVTGTITTGVFVLSSLALMNSPLGLYGIPLASSLAAIFLAITLSIQLRSDAGGLAMRPLAATLAKSLLAAAIIAIPVWLAARYISVDQFAGGKLFSAVRLLMLGTVGALGYAAITRRLGMPETAYFDRAAARFKRRSA